MLPPVLYVKLELAEKAVELVLEQSRDLRGSSDAGFTLGCC